MAEDKLLMQFNTTFTNSVLLIVGFMLIGRFSEFNCTYYITNTFMRMCLKPTQLKEVKALIFTFFKITTGLMLVPAVLADCYIDKIYMLKLMSILGSLAPCLLVTLAFICRDFSYSSQYEMKRNLLSSHFSFDILNDLAIPVQLSILCDQIVNQVNFLLGTTKIFSLYFVGREGVKLVVSLVGLLTAEDKIKASDSLLVSLFVLFFAVFSFTAVARRKIGLFANPPTHHIIIKVTGYLMDVSVGKIVKKMLNASATAGVKYSRNTREDGKAFWHLQLMLVCLIPYFYFVDAISLSSKINAGPKDSDEEVHGRADSRVYGQMITFACLVTTQFVIFPFLYNFKRGYFDNPLRRLYTYHVVMGGLGVAAFYMVMANQRATPETYISNSDQSIVVHNMLNTTTTLKLEEVYVVKAVDIEPYGLHTFIFSHNEPVSVKVVNEFYHMDDFYYFTVNREDAFVVTLFGLEELPISEYKDSSLQKKKSRIFLLCLMVVCRGYVHLECGRTSIRPELIAFGVKTMVEEPLGVNCSASLVDTNGVELSTVRFTPSDPATYLVAVENANTTKLHILLRGQDIVYSHWSILPVQVLSSIVNCMFWITLSQFLLLEAPKSLRTTSFATCCLYQYVAHILCANYLSKNGLYSERNGFFVLGAYVVSFVCFAFITSTYKIRQTIEAFRAAEVAEARRKMSSRLSMASNASSLVSSTPQPMMSRY